jgi:hypothetical protein
MKSLKNAFSSLFSKATDEMAALRSEIADVKNQITDLSERPLSFAEAKARLDSFVDSLPNALPVGEFATRTIRAPQVHVSPSLPIAHLIALLTGNEGVRAHLTAQLKADIAARPDAMSAADFEAAHAALVSRLRSLEEREEEFLRDAETAGMSVTRRHDADIAVVLNCR